MSLRILLGSLQIDFSDREVNNCNRETAKEIAGFLRQRARQVDLPMDWSLTWCEVAAGLNCNVHPYYAPDGPYGEYSATRRGTGVITYNRAYSEQRQAAVLIHELAHHVLFLWSDDPAAFAYTMYTGEDDPDSTRHQIARLVEDLILGRE